MFVYIFLADKSDPKPGGTTQEVGQLLQDMGDDVYQQYRSLTRQSSDFDTQSGFSLNVSQFQLSYIFLLFPLLLLSQYLGLSKGSFKSISFVSMMVRTFNWSQHSGDRRKQVFMNSKPPWITYWDPVFRKSINFNICVNYLLQKSKVY